MIDTITRASLLVAVCCSCTSTPKHKAGEGTDAGSDSGAVLAQASAELIQIRPRKTVGPQADTTDLNAETAWWPVTAKVTFRTTSEGVDLNLRAVMCRTAYSYPVHIYATSDCSAITRDSKPWDGARGMLHAKAFCIGGPGAGVYESRLNVDPKPWSLGGPVASNLIGRTIAIHDPDTLEPLACGTIGAPDGGTPWVALSPAQRPRNLVVEQLAGLCGLGLVATPDAADAGQTCPDPATISACALTHCVSGCLDVCADQVACLEATSETCTSACQPNAACQSCLALITQCTLGFCQDDLACSPPPTPGGPCTEFRECCMRQGPLVESCLTYAALLEHLSGDPSCLGALSDWDVNTHFTYRSPCYPDGGMPMQ